MVYPPREASMAIVPYVRPPTAEEFLTLQRERAVNAAFKRGLDLERYAARQLSGFGDGRVIAIVGTSTAGKSSIIRKLCKSRGWVEKGIDLSRQSADAYAMRNLRPDLYAIIIQAINHIDIAFAIFCDTVRFKEGTPPQLKKAALLAIAELKKNIEEIQSRTTDDDETERQMFEEIQMLSQRGKNVIYDELGFEFLMKNIAISNFSAPIKIALAYCPFRTLARRVTIRNRRAMRSGNMANYRISSNPLVHFTELYGPAKPGDTVIDTVTRTEVEEALTTAFEQESEYFAAEDAKEGKPTCSDLPFAQQKRKQEILTNLGFTDPSVQEVQITPLNTRFHNLLNTGQMQPQDSVKQLLAW